MAIERLACIIVPQFPLRALYRGRPLPTKRPLAVAESGDGNGLIVAVNEAASAVATGLTVAQARTHLPQLRVLTRKTELEIKESSRLVRRLQTVGPRVEADEPGRYYLQIHDLRRLYRSEVKTGQRLLGAFEKTAYPVKVGLAANKLVARIAAELTTVNNVTIVPPDAVRQYLAPLPISRLPLPEETRSQLQALGLQTIAHLAVLPPNEITRRFGDEVAALAQYARGLDPALLAPEELPDEHSAWVHLDYPTDNVRHLRPHLEQLLQSLLEPLQRIDCGCQKVRLRLACSDGTTVDADVALQHPTASLPRLMRQVRRHIESPRFRITDTVISISVRLHAVRPLSADQLSVMPEGHDVGTSPSDVPAIATHHRLLRIGRRARLLPEQRFVYHTEGSSSSVSSPPDQTTAGLPCAVRSPLGLRLFDPPSKVIVTTREGELLSVHLNRRTFRITGQHGPWHLSGGWWQQAFDRWYVEVDTETGLACLLFYDNVHARWYMQGVFD